MAVIPYMPLYISDYLADAAHLTAIQHGAYLMLLMNYWQRGKALPASDAALANIARMTPEEWTANREIIASFFTESEGTWVNQRAEKELAAFRQKSEASRMAGIASAAKRKLLPNPTDVERALNERSTDAQRSFNGCSTVVQRPFNHTDTDTDTVKPPLSPLPQKRTRGTRLADSHKTLEPSWVGWCRTELGWDTGRADRTWDKFSDFWNAKAGKDGVKLDWFATWRNWCRTEEERNPSRSQAPLPLPPIQPWVDELKNDPEAYR